jgi:hypothetical protein
MREVFNNWNCQWACEKINLLIKPKSLAEHDAPPIKSAINQIEQQNSEIRY